MKETAITIKKIQTRYRTRFLKIFKTSPDYARLVEVIKTSPHNVFSSISRVEARKFDEKWIDELEKGVIAIGNIVANPKRFIKFEGEVVPIEMAKKTTSESIRHLAQNSQFIREIDLKKGIIMPEKILNIASDDDYAIYENRFVMTLIRKLIRFIELRYDYIIKKAEARDTEVLNVKSKVTIDGVEYEYEGKLRQSAISSEEGKKAANDELLRRINEMRQRSIFFLSSEFMRNLKGAGPVTNPLQQTNLMRHHPDYSACQDLWKFLDRYEQLGVSFQIKETSNVFDDAYIQNIFAHIGASYLLINADRNKKIKVTQEQIQKRKVTPYLAQPILDKDLTDERFLTFDGAKSVKTRTLTPAQEAALKKRRELAAKAKLEREKLRALEKQKAAAKKERERLRQIAQAEREKALMKLRALKQKEQLRLRKEAQALRQAEQEKIKREHEQMKKLIDEERRLLAEARQAVRQLAQSQKKADQASQTKAG